MWSPARFRPEGRSLASFEGEEMKGSVRKGRGCLRIGEQGSPKAVVRDARDWLLGRYWLRLSRQLAEAAKAGSPLADCVAVVIRTEGDADVAAIASRADALEVARVVGLDECLRRPPAPFHLPVFTFALRAGGVRTVTV